VEETALRRQFDLRERLVHCRKRSEEKGIGMFKLPKLAAFI
jgi:hypothetical protein